MNRSAVRLEDLLPHRKPMLLLDRLVSVDANTAQTEVIIDSDSAFSDDLQGVPSWVGLEYMGQTAALIGGHQALLAAQRNAHLEPRLGYLVGTRCYRAHCSYFRFGATLQISCIEDRAVGESLARYRCAITGAENGAPLAEAVLTVVRKPLAEARLL